MVGIDRVLPSSVEGAEQVAEILAKTREALGGEERLDGLTALTAEGPFRRSIGPRDMEGTIRLLHGVSSGPGGPGGDPVPMVMGGGGSGGGGPVMMGIEGGGSRYRLDLYVQAFNVFNHTNYTQFIGNMRSPFFGTATSAGPARRIEGGATFRF